MTAQALGDFTKLPALDGAKNLQKAQNIDGAQGVIDEYGLVFGSRIGGGFFSDVFQIESPHFRSKNLLMKIVDYDRCSNKLNYHNELNITKFMRENPSSHKNLLEVFELIEFERSQFWIVFERFGMVLERFVLSFREGFPLCNARHVFKQLSSVVQYCHSNLIVHRDISDTNILIDPETMLIKLIDFGFGKKTSEEFQVEKDKILCFSNKGTFQFMAPELLHERSMEKLFYDGIKVDVYSVGVVLYFLIFQNYPFKLDEDYKNDFGKMVDAYHLIKNVPKVIPEVKAPYEQLINDMLAADPDDRPLLPVVDQHEFLKQESCS